MISAAMNLVSSGDSFPKKSQHVVITFSLHDTEKLSVGCEIKDEVEILFVLKTSVLYNLHRMTSTSSLCWGGQGG